MDISKEEQQRRQFEDILFDLSKLLQFQDHSLGHPHSFQDQDKHRSLDRSSHYLCQRIQDSR